MLLSQNLVVEELGGDIQAVPISALTGTGVSQLTEAIIAQAEMMSLVAEYTGLVEGTIVESKFDTHRGWEESHLFGVDETGFLFVSGYLSTTKNFLLIFFIFI